MGHLSDFTDTKLIYIYISKCSWFQSLNVRYQNMLKVHAEKNVFRYKTFITPQWHPLTFFCCTAITCINVGLFFCFARNSVIQHVRLLHTLLFCSILKIGVSCKDDGRKLFKDYGLSVSGCVDLRHMLGRVRGYQWWVFLSPWMSRGTYHNDPKSSDR